MIYDDKRLWTKSEQLRVDWINELQLLTEGNSLQDEEDLLATFRAVTYKDMLQKLSEEEKDFLWTYRESPALDSSFWLHTLLDVVDWRDPKQVAELHRVMKKYPGMFDLKDHPIIAPLMILRESTPDVIVRNHAIECLRKMNLSSHQMRFWMPQFIQSLKSETLHWSSSSLLRYLQSNINTLPSALSLFWQLKVETRSLHYKRMDFVIDEIHKGFSEPDVLDEQERLWGEQGVFANISRECYKLSKGISSAGEVKIFSGTLRKRAIKSGRNWSKRAFVLYPGKLCYFKDAMRDKVPTGT